MVQLLALKRIELPIELILYLYLYIICTWPTSLSRETNLEKICPRKLCLDQVVVSDEYLEQIGE